ncbi:MAG: hypothetical protein ACRC6T_08575 [Sarcina sp.]
MDKQSFVNLSSKVFEEILKLSDKEINAFLNNEKKIALIDVEKEVKQNEKIAKTTKKEVEKKNVTRNGQIDYLVKKLDSAKNRDEAKKILEDKKITNKMLREVGDKLGLYINTKATKVKIIDKLIEETIGLKLKMKNLRGK